MRIILAVLLVICSHSSWAKNEVLYNISFKNAVHHEAEVSATFNNIETAILEVKMSRSSPGRYALHEFAKNVYHVKAFNGKGEELIISRPNPYQWNVEHHDGEVMFNYTLFADRADGTYSQIDRTHAHLNIPATFVWAEGFENVPVKVRFKPFDKNWQVATQLRKTRKKYTYTAPNLAYFMDSPTELSDHQVNQWTVKSNGKKYKIKLAVHHDGNDDDMEEYTRQAKAVLEQQKQVFGEFPDFDYGEYTFIACYLPHASGDGMEHRNSTILTSSTSLDEGEFAQLGTLSHEFFHAWNVERIRPKTLEPFDFSSANMTKNLWFAEGFTTYYGDLLIRRAQETSVDEYIDTVTKIVNQANFFPGRKYFTPEGASMMAPFTDAGTSIDKTNFKNIFFSYYIYGRAMALALDLSIRTNFPGKTLDDYMAMMWRDFGKKEQPYTRDDLRITLGKLLKDQPFADDFFAEHIHGQAIPDFKTLLGPAGLLVEVANKDEAYLGNVRFSFKGEAAIVSSVIKVDTPLYNIGIERGDQITKLGRRTIRSKKLWNKALAQFAPGDTTTIEYIQRGSSLSKKITFIENPELVVKLNDEEKMTEQHKAFRSAWLGDEKE